MGVVVVAMMQVVLVVMIRGLVVLAAVINDLFLVFMRVSISRILSAGFLSDRMRKEFRVSPKSIP